MSTLSEVTTTVVSMSATEQAAGLAPERVVSRAVAAVYVAFIGSGFAFARRASRIRGSRMIRTAVGASDDLGWC